MEDTLARQDSVLVTLTTDLSKLRSELVDAKVDIAKQIAPIGVAIIGDNDTLGLRERVRALEAAKNNTRWGLGIIATSIVPLLAKTIVDFLNKHQ